MFRNLFYRNARAAQHLQVFFVSAIATVLALRLFLYITGYPQVGGSDFHVAHMLYGGFLMMAAIVLMVSFLGERIKNLGVLVGGIGFGLFIDELGKFITKDNNYFFRPTIGLLYAIFAIIFLVFNYLGRKTRLRDSEYELNALNQLEEAILKDLDPREKQRITELLDSVSAPTVITKSLRTILQAVETVPTPKPNRVKLLLDQAAHSYENFWKMPRASMLISIIFVGQALFFLGTVIYALVANFDTAVGLNATNGAYANRLLVADFISSGVSALFAIAGAIKLFSSRSEAFERFRVSLLTSIFLSQFFAFSRIQFDALPGFVFNLALLLAVYIAMDQERRSHAG